MQIVVEPRSILQAQCDEREYAEPPLKMLLSGIFLPILVVVILHMTVSFAIPQ
jgi:hypothetical protein